MAGDSRVSGHRSRSGRPLHPVPTMPTPTLRLTCVPPRGDVYYTAGLRLPTRPTMIAARSPEHLGEGCEMRNVRTPQPSTTLTPGAIKAGAGRYTFDLAALHTIDAGPGYSTAHGSVIEGERIQIGLMRVPRGTGGRPHSHPNEQGIYVLRGTLESAGDGVKSRVPAGSLVFNPLHVLHSAPAPPDGAGVLLTATDTSHGSARARRRP